MNTYLGEIEKNALNEWLSSKIIYLHGGSIQKHLHTL